MQARSARQSLLVPLGEGTIGPAELPFGGALTGVICRWKLTLAADLRTTDRAHCVITGIKQSPLQENFNYLGCEVRPAAIQRAMLAKLDRDGRTARKLPFATDCLWPQLCGNACNFLGLGRHSQFLPAFACNFVRESLRRFTNRVSPLEGHCSALRRAQIAAYETFAVSTRGNSSVPRIRITRFRL